MTWLKIDDRFYQHPKVLDAGNAATGLWVRCASWSASYLTDGVIHRDIVTQFGTRRETERCTAAGLWVPAGGDFVLPDFLDYNPSKEDVLRRRKADAERKRKGSDDDPFQ